MEQGADQVNLKRPPPLCGKLQIKGSQQKMVERKEVFETIWNGKAEPPPKPGRRRPPRIWDATEKGGEKGSLRNDLEW